MALGVSCNMFVLLVVGLSVFSSPTCVTAVYPGFKTRITQSGLNYLRDSGLKTLITAVEHLVIPDINGEAHVDVIGRISYTISNIQIKSVAIPSSSLATKTGVGVTLRLSEISLSGLGNWHYNNHGFIHVRDSGTFDTSISSTSLDLTLRIGIDNYGRPTVHSETSDCSFNIGHVEFKLHGGASWLYNLFSGKINGAIMSSLNKETCKAILKQINVNLQRVMASLNTEATIDHQANIDYSLIAPPMFNGHIDISHKGEVFATGTPHTEAPFPVPVIPPDPDISRHVFLWITDYMLETAGYVYYKAGVFAYDATQDKLPPDMKGSLLLSEYGIHFFPPQLYSMFPGKYMQVNVKATAPPAVDISQQHINGSVKLQIDAFVIMPNKSRHFAFALDTIMHGSFSVDIDDTGSRLTWHANLVRIDTTLKRSGIGKFDMKYITGGLKAGCNSVLVPWLNEEGVKGISLPTGKDFKLQNAVIQQGKSFVKFGTDVVYLRDGS